MKGDRLLKASLAVGIILLFLGACIISAHAQGASRTIPASGGTWLFVGGSGPGNYTRIQDAIDNASTGDTVYVYDDSAPYLEQLTINTTITLLGENQTSTIINSTADGYYTVITINADDVVLSGFFIILNGGPGIEVFANHTRLSNLTMRSGLNDGWSGTGIELHTTHGAEIIDTLITNVQIGILLSDSTYTTVTHNRIINPGLNGITLYSSDNVIDENTIVGNMDQYTQPVGIHISGARNRLSHNTITAMLGTALDGVALHGVTGGVIEENDLQNTGFVQGNSEANQFVNNTVNGKPFVFLVNQSDAIVDNAGQVILVNCTRVAVQDLTLAHVPHGVQLVGTIDSVVQRCHISSCRYGASLDVSSGNLLQNNTISDCEWGINIYQGDSNRVENNTIARSAYSGLLICSTDTLVSDNRVSNCSVGITITDCVRNFVSQNAIRRCAYGVLLESTTSNTIARNIFLDNWLLAGFQRNSLFNHWDGNYWGRPRVVPKVVPGVIVLTWHPDPIHYRSIVIPWMNVDWRPALKR